MRLTVGMRCRFKDGTHWTNKYHAEFRGKECLLVERCSGDFSVMVLGQKDLKKKDPNTVVDEVAWVNEKCLEFVNDKFKENLDFLDWYQEHEDEFCDDCGVWFPNNGGIDPKTDECYRCPNKKCPGRGK